MPEQSDHVAGKSLKELAPVNTALILVTSLCTGGLTVISEFLGKSMEHFAPYILVAVWLLAILLCVALIGRDEAVDKNDEAATRNLTNGSWLKRWTLCTKRGASLVKRKWAYSLLLLVMATLGGATSYINFKRAHSQLPLVQGHTAGDGDIFAYLSEGNVKAITVEKSAGREDFKYTHPIMGNALEGLVIKGGPDAIRTLELAPPSTTELNTPFKGSIIYNYGETFPKSWGDNIFTALGIRVVDKVPKPMDAGTIYLERDLEFVSKFYTTPLMLAIWSQDVAVMQKLISLGADTTTATSFQLNMVKVKPNKPRDLITTKRAEVKLFPANEAKRVGGAVAAAFPPSTSNQAASSVRLLD